MQENGIKQSVVFAASSTCGVAEEQCSEVPASPLAHEASRADALHYLDQGMAIGPVKDIYEIYRRAVAIIERSEDSHLSELAVFGEIFSNQENHRNLLKPSTRSWSRRFCDLFSGHNSLRPLARKDSNDLITATTSVLAWTTSANSLSAPRQCRQATHGKAMQTCLGTFSIRCLPFGQLLVKGYHLRRPGRIWHYSLIPIQMPYQRRYTTTTTSPTTIMLASNCGSNYGSPSTHVGSLTLTLPCLRCHLPP